MDDEKIEHESFAVLKMKIRYQCGHCGCVYDAFIECQNCNTDDFIEKSFQCNFCNKIFSSSNHNCKKGDTFESEYNKYFNHYYYLNNLSIQELLNKLKQLHDQSIQIEKNKEYRYTKKEELICQLKDYENQLKEKDKVISLRNIEITQRKQDYKELQAEIEKLKSPKVNWDVA